MNILHISLMSSCNFDCYYCTVKKWLRPLETAQSLGRNLLTNEALLKWFDAFIKPDEWYIELIGGEPGLYPQISELIPAITEKGYYGIVKTNGSLPIPESPNFIRAAAWHKDRDLPQYFDQLVIIKNPDDTWRDKESYCKKKKIKYQLVDYDRRCEGILNTDLMKGYEPNKAIYSQHINSSGEVTCCPAATPVMQDGVCTIFDMAPPIYTNILLTSCKCCKNIHDVELFLPDDIREKFNDDFERRKK
ncbi:MAG: hypothetical protein LBH20_04565 [Treponema sp.]|jgi:organic radical activating enzyme|nr:hypothetical protein [Treponema sp.]